MSKGVKNKVISFEFDFYCVVSRVGFYVFTWRIYFLKNLK